MDFDLVATKRLLARTPGILEGLLHNLDESWTHRGYGENSFSAFDVVGHLIHGEETDWIPRINLILTTGEAIPFEPFDRFAMVLKSQGQSLDQLLLMFTELRNANIQTLNQLEIGPTQLNLRGSHPDLGAVTLRQLLATWTVHDMGHIAQICKAMSFQYRNAVGPWHTYISILRSPAR